MNWPSQILIFFLGAALGGVLVFFLALGYFLHGMTGK